MANDPIEPMEQPSSFMGFDEPGRTPPPARLPRALVVVLASLGIVTLMALAQLGRQGSDGTCAHVRSNGAAIFLVFRSTSIFEWNREDWLEIAPDQLPGGHDGTVRFEYLGAGSIGDIVAADCDPDHDSAYSLLG